MKPLLIQRTKHTDERGSFEELYNVLTPDYLMNIAQINRSVSKAGVIRGLHYQPGQGKLVTCTKGAVYDFVLNVDTLEHWVFYLSAEETKSVWIPGSKLAHGFYALQDSEVVYTCSDTWNKEKEICIQAIDNSLPFLQYIGTDVLQSEKDRSALTYAQLKKKGIL